MDDDAPAGGPKPRLVGINHVALEVGEVEAALAFYGRIFEFTLRGKGEGHAFIDMGDQFIALLETPAAHMLGRGRRFWAGFSVPPAQVPAAPSGSSGETCRGMTDRGRGSAGS